MPVETKTRCLALATALCLSLAHGAFAARRPTNDATAESDQDSDWLRRRQTFTMNAVPYGLTGVPIIFYTPSSGFHYGGWVEVANYGARPYRYRINVQWWLTTLGKRDHHIRLDIPEVFNFPFNVRLMTQDLKDIRAAYYGIGNDTKKDEQPLAANPEYYFYQLEQQKTGLDIEGRLSKAVVLFAGMRLNRGAPARVNEARDDYFAFEDSTLLGIEAGWTNFLVAGVIADTRDDEELPSKGFLAELSVQKGYAWLGSDYVYRRMTFIASYYHPIRGARRGPRYVLLTRILFENLEGDVPFYVKTEVGGSIRGFAVGGNETMRGYDSRRFADNQKLLLTLELRRIFTDLRIGGQFLQSQGMAFVDLGRVAATLDDLSPVGLHPSAGIGGRMVWNSQLNIRADVAFSPEGHRFLLTFGNLF